MWRDLQDRMTMDIYLDGDWDVLRVPMEESVALSKRAFIDIVDELQRVRANPKSAPPDVLNPPGCIPLEPGPDVIIDFEDEPPPFKSLEECFIETTSKSFDNDCLANSMRILYGDDNGKGSE